jgi:shikimate kinase
MGSGSGSGGHRRILLVGFMGSGKSTVGALLAARLGWSFFDFDVEIARRAGRSVEEIFREEGEASFRSLEAEVGRDLLREDRAVLATGGGWPASEGRMESVGEDTLSVWLQVSAESSLERIRGAAPARPLLAVPDPRERAERLLAERSGYYGRARLHLDTETTSPGELVDTILRHLEAAAPDASGR